MQPHLVLAIGMPSGFEWLILLVIGLLIFGNRLPSLMRGLGGSVKSFKDGMEGANPAKMVESAPATAVQAQAQVPVPPTQGQPPVTPPHA